MRTKIIAAVFAALSLTACSSGTTSTTETAATTEPTPAISVANAFVRATDSMSGPAAGPWMTGAFMEINNNGDADITLTGGNADFADMVQIHEVVDGQMQMKEGGLVIKAGTTETLQPGGNHVMLMGMQEQTKVGEERTFTLSFSDGSTIEVTASVKEVALGGEKYTGSTSSM